MLVVLTVAGFLTFNSDLGPQQCHAIAAELNKSSIVATAFCLYDKSEDDDTPTVTK